MCVCVCVCVCVCILIIHINFQKLMVVETFFLGYSRYYMAQQEEISSSIDI